MDTRSMRATAPAPNPTISFWQSQPIDAEELRIPDGDCNPDLPYDLIIIGSGITGATIAYTLLVERGVKLRTLMLEARDICSGATGRNGGHIKPDRYKGVDEYSPFHGEKAALKQLLMERECLRSMTDFIHREGIAKEIDFFSHPTFDTYMTQAAWEKGKATLQRYELAGGDVSDITLYETEQATKASGIKCFGAISYPAASLWPYKLVCFMLRKARDAGLDVHSHEPVIRISRNETDFHTVQSEIRTYKTRRVVHATNGWSSHLLPELEGRIIPLKGHVSAIAPKGSEESLPGSAGIQWGEDFDYLIQRRTGRKFLIFGGGDLHHPDGIAAVLGDSDDSFVTKEIVEYLESFPAKYIVGQQERSFRCESQATYDSQEVERSWSGIYAFSKDLMPCVGELPGICGQYICAGYHGRGMSKAFLCAKALCDILQGLKPLDYIPSQYFDLESRLATPIDWKKHI